MMTKNDLKDLLKDNSSEERHKIDAAATVNIGRFAFVSLQMDNKTLGYYYEIDIDELLNSAGYNITWIGGTMLLRQE